MAIEEEERELRAAALQNAQAILLTRRQAEQALRDQTELLRVTLTSIGDAVISTDAESRITFMNGVAEKLTGWTNTEAKGRLLPEVFRIVNESTRLIVENPALRALREGTVVGLANHTILIAKDGTEWPIDDSAAPIRDQLGNVSGAVLVFREIVERKRHEDTEAERNRLVALRADVSMALASASSSSIVLHQCCDGFVRHLNAAFARIWTLNQETDVLEMQASAGLYTHLDGPHSRIRVGDYKIGRIAANRTPHLTNTVFDDPNISNQAWARSEGMQAFAGFPLMVEDRVVGVLAMFAREPVSEIVLTELPPLVDGIAQFIDRRRAEEEARVAHSRLNSALAAAEIGTWEFDIVRNIVRADKNLARMFGLNPAEAAGGSLESYMRAIHPDDRARVAEVTARAIEAGDTLNAEYRLVGTDGKLTWVDARGRVERDHSNRPLRLPGVVVDITERKLAEASLRESEERFRMLFDSMDEGFCIVEILLDSNGTANDYRFLEVNPAFLKQTGLTDAVGKTMRQLAPEHEAFWFETYGRVAKTGESIRFVHEAKALGGRWFDVFAFRLVQPGYQKVAIVFHDITVGLRAEKQLRKSEEQRRLALDAGELGGWNIDLATNVMESDDRFRLIFSGKTEPIDYEQAFGMIHPDDLGRVREAVAVATLPNDPLPYAEEYRVIHPGGEVRWVFAKGRANFVDEGAIKRLASFDGTVADITDRKHMEDELRKVAADMSEADHRKDEFLAMLAHELRNPLAPIRNALQIVQISAGDEHAVREASEMIDRQVHHMVRLVDDLLDVSRITRGKIDLRLERVDLGAVLRQAVDTSRPAIEVARHKLTMTLPIKTAWLHADPIRLAQVFSNLINNACKYSEPDGRITLTAEVHNAEIIVSVKDTGIGIPAPMLPKIFELFTQVDQSLERSQGGLGIGLSLVKSLVELHGGSVSAMSEGPGRGSEFLVRLPIFAQQAVAADPPNVVKVNQTVSRRILVVDDNHDSATSLAMLLKLKGNETRTAHDGLEAVETASAFRPDLVLLDIGLPKLNGYEAARKIREQEWGQSIVLVALTGWGQDEDRRKSTEAGFNSHLVKPIEYAAILKLVAELSPRAD